MSKNVVKLVESDSMDKKKALDAALSQIERAFGKGSVMKLGGAEGVVEIESIPTGSLGLEAVSRGAATVSFVEMQAGVLKVARQNAADLGVADLCRFLRADAVAYLERYHGPPFDLILADPPYDLEALPSLPDLALPHLNPGGLFLLEHDARLTFDGHPHLDTSRPYGRTIVSVFRANSPED